MMMLKQTGVEKDPGIIEVCIVNVVLVSGKWNYCQRGLFCQEQLTLLWLLKKISSGQSRNSYILLYEYFSYIAYIALIHLETNSFLQKWFYFNSKRA